jgi:hypothetical protein
MGVRSTVGTGQAYRRAQSAYVGGPAGEGARSRLATRVARVERRRSTKASSGQSPLIPLRSCSSNALVPATGSPSMAQHQIAPPPPDNSCRHRSPPDAACANPKTKAYPSVLASSTSMDSESENYALGTPGRFILVEIRSRRPAGAGSAPGFEVPLTLWDLRFG